MRNQDLATDYVNRAAGRLRALDVLYEDGHWADVVREAQEVVELALKAVLRAHGVDPPRLHDVSDVLIAEKDRLPAAVTAEMDALVGISRSLRRDRELAFYGAEDLTPSGFYSKDDATRAREGARLTVKIVRPHV
jgi:hypothetical protein